MGDSDRARALSEASRLVEAALSMTEQRLAPVPVGEPFGAMLASIGNQLRFMRDTLAAARAPTVSEKNSLSAGVIAVRELETSDPGYCDAICEAVFAFSKL